MMAAGRPDEEKNGTKEYQFLFFVCHVNYSVRIALQMGENVFLSTAFLFS